VKHLPEIRPHLSGHARTVPVWTRGSATVTISATSHSDFALGVEAGTLEQLGPLSPGH
jgi:hypothetical protein